MNDIQIICAEIIVIFRSVNLCQPLLGIKENINQIKNGQQCHHRDIEHKMFANIINQILNETTHRVLLQAKLIGLRCQSPIRLSIKTRQGEGGQIERRGNILRKLRGDFTQHAGKLEAVTAQTGD